MTIIIAILCTTAGIALISDFNGTYKKVPSIRDPWCGKSIEILKIRFNKYRISWDLITGERSVVELYGKVNGDMIDCRNRKDNKLYGYTYALADKKKKLVVTLTVPNKTIVCEFTRVDE